MTGFWGMTKWGQTRDKLNRDVTKFSTHARNRTTMRFVTVGILSQFCPRCDKICHNSLIHQSNCHISYRNGVFVMTILSSVCHILHFWYFCYDKICLQFVTSYTFCHFVMTTVPRLGFRS